MREAKGGAGGCGCEEGGGGRRGMTSGGSVSTASLCACLLKYEYEWRVAGRSEWKAEAVPGAPSLANGLTLEKSTAAGA